MKTNELAALELELGEALGWTFLEGIRFAGAVCGHHGIPPGEQSGLARRTIPQWARKWEACGPLMTEHVASITHYPEIVFVANGVTGTISEKYAAHKDKDTAVRVAICRAVLAKLKGQKQ